MYFASGTPFLHMHMHASNFTQVNYPLVPCTISCLIRQQHIQKALMHKGTITCRTSLLDVSSAESGHLLIGQSWYQLNHVQHINSTCWKQSHPQVLCQGVQPALPTAGCGFQISRVAYNLLRKLKQGMKGGKDEAPLGCSLREEVLLSVHGEHEGYFEEQGEGSVVHVCYFTHHKLQFSGILFYQPRNRKIIPM